MSSRAVVLNTAVLFFFAIVVFRLADRMLLNYGSLSERAKSQHLKKTDIQVRRGAIYDRKGRELAVNLEVESLYCNPRDVGSPEETASLISGVTGMEYSSVLGRLKSAERFVWLERKLNTETADRLRDKGVKGIGFYPDAKRFYPKGSLASHIVGFAGIDNQPLEGVELQYDSTLRNKGGMLYVSRDAAGRPLSEGMEFESNGNAVVLTIDEGLQHIAEKELEGAWRKWNASGGSVIMMDPYTGEVLALANRPTYDLNSYGGSSASARRNRAITDTYEPGSTFKIVAAAASLQEGLAEPDTKFDCSKGYIEVGGKRIEDVHRSGVLTFKEVVQKSSNVGAVTMGLRLGPERLHEYADRLGFGHKTGIDLPGEVSGLLKSPKKWSGTSIGAVSIGYEISVTPLQMLRAYAAIANGGRLVTPHVIKEIRSPEGRLISRYKLASSTPVLSKETVTALMDALMAVTEEGGTASSAALQGSVVAGKTGTARLIDKNTGRYSTRDYVSSFVGFVPADRPRIAMIVTVFEPRGAIYGGVVAAPVFKGIAEKALGYLNVPVDEMRGKEVLVVRSGGNESKESY